MVEKRGSCSQQELPQCPKASGSRQAERDADVLRGAHCGDVPHHVMVMRIPIRDSEWGKPSSRTWRVQTLRLLWCRTSKWKIGRERARPI